MRACDLRGLRAGAAVDDDERVVLGRETCGRLHHLRHWPTLARRRWAGSELLRCRHTSSLSSFPVRGTLPRLRRGWPRPTTARCRPRHNGELDNSHLCLRRQRTRLLRMFFQITQVALSHYCHSIMTETIYHFYPRLSRTFYPYLP